MVEERGKGESGRRGKRKGRKGGRGEVRKEVQGRNREEKLLVL